VLRGTLEVVTQLGSFRPPLWKARRLELLCAAPRDRLYCSAVLRLGTEEGGEGSGSAHGSAIELSLRTAVLSAVESLVGREHSFCLSSDELGLQLAFAASSAAASHHWHQRLREAILCSTDEVWLADHIRHLAAACVQARWRGRVSRRAHRNAPTAAAHSGNTATAATATAPGSQAVRGAAVANKPSAVVFDQGIT
jgi:hypothetical protein